MGAEEQRMYLDQCKILIFLAAESGNYYVRQRNVLIPIRSVSRNLIDPPSNVCANWSLSHTLVFCNISNIF